MGIIFDRVLLTAELSDTARFGTGFKLDFNFSKIDDKYSFFSLSINVVESVKQNN